MWIFHFFLKMSSHFLIVPFSYCGPSAWHLFPYSAAGKLLSHFQDSASPAGTSLSTLIQQNLFWTSISTMQTFSRNSYSHLHSFSNLFTLLFPQPPHYTGVILWLVRRLSWTKRSLKVWPGSNYSWTPQHLGYTDFIHRSNVPQWMGVWKRESPGFLES